MSKKRPPSGYDFASFKKRIDFINEKTGLKLNAEKRWWDEDLKGIIENPIGFVKVPLAIAGPLKIQGDYAKGEFLIPFCTLEGSLAISLVNGVFIANQAGGINTHYLKQEMPRSPMFFLPSLESEAIFKKWIEQNFPRIKEVAKESSSSIELLKIDSYPVGRKVILDFIFSTGNYSGQNLATIATQAVCEFIQKAFDKENPLSFLIESNFSGDKNGCYRNLIKGRGHAAIATVNIPEKVFKRVLHLDVQEAENSLNHGALASSLAGLIGHNLHTANALAGLYLATGQDLACVAENSGSLLHGEILSDGSLECSLTLPSITVGTEGNGTVLVDQQTNLRMLGCLGEDSSKKFAEIVAAVALALEISLGTAINHNDLANAHKKYG